MLGTSLHLGRGHGDDRFYNPAKARRNYLLHHQNTQRSRSGGALSGTVSIGKAAVLEGREPENRKGSGEGSSKPPAVPASSSLSSSSPSFAPAMGPFSNLDSFLESTAPSVPAQYFPKTRMRGWRTYDVELRPYFTLGDVWESFKEWSAYGAGVPLILNDSDDVCQYYVPYLSGIQLYGDPSMQVLSCRRPGEESDGDCYRDSGSDGSSDYESERGLKSKEYSRNQLSCTSLLRMDRLSLRENRVAIQEGFSSDDGEAGNSQGCLLFEYLEQDSPYSREPLADKISDLAQHFPELKTLRSCDLLPASWISVAWYPIYRIPTGPTLTDLDACFLTFHSLSTQMKGAGGASGPNIPCPPGIDGVPKISLPSFGLASYKVRGSMWTPNEYERQLASSLLQAADNWLRLLCVHHPDYQFFASHGASRR